MVRGEPTPQGSKRGFVVPGKNGSKPRAVVVEDNKRIRPWRALIVDAASRTWEGREPLDGPIGAELVFSLSKPRTVKRDFPSVKPDVDKLTRAALDGMKGIIWRDDAQVVHLEAQKIYADAGRPPGLYVEIFQIPR